MTDFGKTTVDGFMAGTRAATKRFEAIKEEIDAFNKAQFKDATAVMEAVKGAKSVNEALDLQLDFARRAFEAGLKQASKLGALGFDMLQESIKHQQATFEPITKQAMAAVEKIGKPRAA
jgi:hypothetical protein